ncbi:ATP-binding cassette domain-containing protein [Lyngbya aestuarii]|uniref:ATP-binding cassette domain-containing protein n=1 Tax=Lyngbya aestuarii TaxID=118322 RepID=UPI00403D5942
MPTQNQINHKKLKHRIEHQDYSKGEPTDYILRAENLSAYYGNFLVLRDVSLEIPKHQITAILGASGCGKSTLIRCFNRLNDSIDNFRTEGKLFYKNQNLYSAEVDPILVRRWIGIVFEKACPFPKSIYNNIAYGARINNYKGDMDELVERSFRQTNLWDEIKDRLKASALSLSSGQKQRLCIARAVALEPEILLMDKPCSSLDPISTKQVEELLYELKSKYTIIIVPHNIQQARRATDMTAFFDRQQAGDGKGFGYLVEYDKTEVIFTNPQQRMTQEYVSGHLYT